MRVMNIGSNKGGAGKTLFAIQFGTYGSLLGMKVLMIDVDVRKPDLTNWAARRKRDSPKVVTRAPLEVPKTIARARQLGYDLVIIDSPGFDAAELAPAIKAADLFLIPTRAEVFDVEAARRTGWMAASLGVPHHYLVTCVVAAQSPRVQFWRSRCERKRLLDAMLGHRVVYGVAAAKGLGVLEEQPRGPAADEIREACALILSRVLEIKK